MDDMGLKEKLQAGECVYGPFVRSADPVISEIIGYAGFDFLILDMEHGPMDVHQAENHVRAAKLAGCAPVIRIRENDSTMVTRALDTGACGVQIPQVNSALSARQAVESSKFYPQGYRGVCRFTRNAQYSNIPKEDYFELANRNTLTIIQIEGAEGVQSIDDILRVEGIDVIFLGPYDLSQSLGVPGKVTDASVLRTIELVTKKARKHGIAVGSFTDDQESLTRHRDLGIQYLSYGIDTGLFYSKMHECCEQIRRR